MVLAYLSGILTIILFSFWLAKTKKKREKGIKSAIVVRITGRDGNKVVQVYARKITDDFPVACDICSPHGDGDLLREGNQPWLCAECFDNLPMGRAMRVE